MPPTRLVQMGSSQGLSRGMHSTRGKMSEERLTGKIRDILIVGRHGKRLDVNRAASYAFEGRDIIDVKGTCTSRCLISIRKA